MKNTLVERSFSLERDDYSLIYRKIGAKVTYYRKLRGWTQIQLSKMSGISTSRISKIECGKQNSNLNDILIIAKALNVDYRVLIS